MAAWAGPSGTGLRLPELLAGLAAVPLVYALGAHVAGRGPGLLAAGLTAAAPFPVFYSGSARAYSLLLALTALTALAALLAVDTGRRRWWILYGLATAAVAYTHYTGVFALIGLYGWIVVTQPAARRPATVAAAGAALLYLPWVLTGLRDDLSSPDSTFAAAFVDFTPGGVLRALGHWTLGAPDGTSSLWRVSPGPVAIVLIAAGVLLALVRARGRPSARMALIVVLAAAAPVGEILASLVGPPSLTTNSLASSWPGLAVAVAALLWRARPYAPALALAGLTIGTVETASPSFARPDFRPAARMIERHARPGDAVLDGSAAFFGSPGPLTPLDASLGDRPRVVRLGFPGRDGRLLGDEQAVATAVALTGRRGRLFVASFNTAFFGTPPDAVARLRSLGLPRAFRVVRRVRQSTHYGVADALELSR